MVPATLVPCIDPDLLENLVCFEEIEGRTDADEVVDPVPRCIDEEVARGGSHAYHN
jgi:hypothetical protein